MNLPMPTRANISLWLENFNKNIMSILNLPVKTIAKKLLGSNYSEIEEFGLSILRMTYSIVTRRKYKRNRFG
jgi:hypothetical protein